ncbi:Clp protease N-terminal domain-containing protein [Rhodococcus sp. IEGM 1307]|uniref:Clp protease N-terminal domain-containing protein n=1 Tax=Rhodococcus sp. IEGM 1307 TaxID=3047091 RepID=UPI0024B6905D|nr:Clp protease N-terminal domain-containing protein [Rhodococcus sp. IEGM 1307]MDI9980040.1 Clp protease N-terminal domain-containing protein [Rhodococcus sp. IEGM 1307]
MVFERFSDQARQVVVLAAGAARTHHQNSVGTEHLLVGIFDAGGPGAAALTSWGVTAPALESKLGGVSAPAGSAPAVGHIPFTPKTKKVLEASLRQTALLGHEEIGTDHLLLALLDDPASTGAHILTDLVTLSIGEMREHLRRELAHRPTPGPAHRIPIRLSDDEYTRAHAAARTAGQNLETWIHDRITDALEQPE